MGNSDCEQAATTAYDDYTPPPDVDTSAQTKFPHRADIIHDYDDDDDEDVCQQQQQPSPVMVRCE